MRRLTLCALLLVAARAGAVEYELPIEVDSEEDLYELFFAEEIGEESFNALLDLLRRGVDLGKADAEELYALPGLSLQDVDAIVAYREASGGIFDPGGLAAAGVLTDEKLAAIAPFVIVAKPEQAGTPTVAGKVKLRGLYSAGDSRVPALAFEAKATSFRHLTVALNTVLTRNNIGDLRYDSSRDALSAEPRATRLRLGKAYAAWRTRDYEIIAGSYTAGFGQRLTFDETTLYSPNGIYPDATLYRRSDLVRECIESTGELGSTPCPSTERQYVTPDFDWRDTLLGLAASLRQLRIGAGWLQLTAWGSAQPRDIYQYEIFDRGKCADPNDDQDDDCSAPAVYRRGADPTEPSAAFSFQTLPTAWVELLGGGNVTWFAARRDHLGLTAWGAQPKWLVGGIDLDFQEWSRFPHGGPYGALGADASFGHNWYDFGVEATRSFDATTGGDLGVIGRAIATWPRNELELSLRWYGRDFINAHTGAIAEPDEVDGQRARDEMGARLRYGGKLSRKLSLRALADFWVQPSTDVPKIRVEARGDYIFTRQFAAGLFTRWSDKDLSGSRQGDCYDVVVTESGETVPCTGQKLDLGASASLTPLKRLGIKLQGQLRLIDDPALMTQFRKDLNMWAMLQWWFTDDARLRARVRYEHPDFSGSIADRTFLDHTLWGYLMLTYRLQRTFMISARYEIRGYFEEGTSKRDPSPEHWLSLEVEAKF